MQRAAHQLLETPRVFDDPLALRIFGAQGVAWLGRNLDRYRTGGARAMRAFLVMRSRYAEDELARRSRAACASTWCSAPDWIPSPTAIRTARLRVFEVDHPVDAGLEAQPAAGAGDRHAALADLRAGGFRDADAGRWTEGGGLSRRPAGVLFLAGGHDLPQQGGGRRHAAHHRRGSKGSQVVFDFAPPSSAIGDQERRQPCEIRSTRGARGRALDQLLRARVRWRRSCAHPAIRRRAPWARRR